MGIFFYRAISHLYASPATGEAMTFLKSLLPENARWSAFGVARRQFPMVAEAVEQGGNVRVGLEDNLYLAKGEYASNGQLVEKAVGIIRDLPGSGVGSDREHTARDPHRERGSRPGVAAPRAATRGSRRTQSG